MAFRTIITTVAAILLSTALSPAALAQDSCGVQIRIEDLPDGAATVHEMAPIIAVPKTGAFSLTSDIPAVTWAVGNTLLYVRDRDCAIPDMNVKFTIGGTDYDANFDGAFGGMVCGGPFEWKTGNESWAGCFPSAGNPVGGVTDYSGGATVTISREDTPDPVPEECEVGVHYEETFGGAIYNATDCANPYYEMPTTAQSWAGFADKITPEGLLPYSFPYGGELTFTCAGSEKVRFRFEPEPGVQEPSIQSHAPEEGYTCDGTPQTWEIPAGTQTWGNPLMYVTPGAAMLVRDITITANEEPEPEPEPEEPAADPATPVPALPFWALLGLVGLVGLFGFRRR